LILRAALNWNVSLSDALERRLPTEFTRSLLYLHELSAAELMNARAGQTVVDVGGGYLCPFAQRRRPELGTRIVALDIDEEQLKANRTADLRAVADAARALPLADRSVDLVVTRSVMEHLPDTKRFLDESFRALKPGACAIHVFPCRNAPFSLLNRLLPNAVSKWLLAALFPQWKGEVGFPAFYMNCTYREMLLRLGEAGYAIERLELRYYQAIYYKFYFPAYLLMLLYDYALWRFDARRLACQILVVARRPAEAAAPAAGPRAAVEPA
jgi:SAM-dependent methyltransferase